MKKSIAQISNGLLYQEGLKGDNTPFYDRCHRNDGCFKGFGLGKLNHLTRRQNIASYILGLVVWDQGAKFDISTLQWWENYLSLSITSAAQRGNSAASPWYAWAEMLNKIVEIQQLTWWYSPKRQYRVQETYLADANFLFGSPNLRACA